MSEETISVGLKCWRAKVVLPEPVAPTRTTSEVGYVELHRHRRNTPIWVGAPSSGSTGPTGASSTA